MRKVIDRMEERDELRVSDKILSYIEKELNQDIKQKDEKIQELNKEIKDLKVKMSE